MSKTKRRGGDSPDPEIVRLAGVAAGLLAEIFQVDKRELLDRPRPSGVLKNVRDLLIGVLHHHFCFNAKTGEVAKRSPATMGKNWSVISQQRIAAALGRDRGVISDAAHEVDDAINGDAGVCVAVSEITESVASLLAQSDAWREALRQEALAQAVKARAVEKAHEIAVLARVDADIAADDAVAPALKIRCHQCYGVGKVTIRRVNGVLTDPAYRQAWDEAEAVDPSTSESRQLTCRFCRGTGQRASQPTAASVSAILAGSKE